MPMESLPEAPTTGSKSQLAWAIKFYADMGWEIDVCQRTVRVGRKAITFDLYGFGDLHGFKRGAVAIIQVTSEQHRPDHKRKILASTRAGKWINNGPYCQIHLITKNTRSTGARTPKGEIKIYEFHPKDFL